MPWTIQPQKLSGWISVMSVSVCCSNSNWKLQLPTIDTRNTNIKNIHIHSLISKGYSWLLTKNLHVWSVASRPATKVRLYHQDYQMLYTNAFLGLYHNWVYLYLIYPKGHKEESFNVRPDALIHHKVNTALYWNKPASSHSQHLCQMKGQQVKYGNWLHCIVSIQSQPQFSPISLHHCCSQQVHLRRH